MSIVARRSGNTPAARRGVDTTPIQSPNDSAARAGVTLRQYDKRGILAIHPKAFLEFFFCDAAAPENTELGDCVIVDVQGPLEQHEHRYWDSYPAIVKRVAEACETSARAVILRCDSPGGDAAGCFDAAVEMRRLCDAAGKQFHAYVDGDCCSAMYALACRAQSITMSNTSLAGSIGVLSTRDDYSAMNASRGLRVALIASGKRKADGHPDQPLTDAEVEATQAVIDSMAGVFYEHVAAGRGVAAEAVAKLEAQVFHGPAAIAAGLVDEIGPLANVLARVAGVANGDTNMNDYEKARAALEKLAEGDDANAKAAKAALAALDAAGGGGDGGDGGDDDDKTDPPAGDDDQQAGSSAGDSPMNDDDDQQAGASANATVKLALKAAAEANKKAEAALAELKRRDERDERAQLIASKPGLAPEMVAVLKQAPIELVRQTIKDLGGSAAAPGNPELARLPTLGKDHGKGDAARLPQAQSDALKLRMGLVGAKTVNESNDYELKLGVVKPAN